MKTERPHQSFSRPKGYQYLRKPAFKIDKQTVTSVVSATESRRVSLVIASNWDVMDKLPHHVRQLGTKYMSEPTTAPNRGAIHIFTLHAINPDTLTASQIRAKLARLSRQRELGSCVTGEHTLLGGGTSACRHHQATGFARNSTTNPRRYSMGISPSAINPKRFPSSSNSCSANPRCFSSSSPNGSPSRSTNSSLSSCSNTSILNMIKPYSRMSCIAFERDLFWSSLSLFLCFLRGSFMS